MSTRTFDSPAFAKQGSGLIQIACPKMHSTSVAEWAARTAWPHPCHSAACLPESLRTDYPPAAARAAFPGFAKSSRILEDITATMPWSQVTSSTAGSARGA